MTYLAIFLKTRSINCYRDRGYEKLGICPCLVSELGRQQVFMAWSW